jgi:hypothetical protein
MQKFIILSVVLAFMSIISFAKDINAWKNEKDLKQQYTVFKENLNFWNGNYFLNETQLNDFYTALSDSVAVLKAEMSNKNRQINDLQNELNSISNKLELTQTERDDSIKDRNSIQLFGININKNGYTFFMSMIILGLFIFTAVVYQLYKRSNTITIKARQDYDELKEEFEKHKKYALDRYAKLNAELHNTRMELKRK